MRRVVRFGLVVVLLLQWGCSAGQRGRWLHEPGWDKPWSYRSGVAAAVCAAIGAGAGVGVQEARTSCASIGFAGEPPNRSCTSISDSGNGTFWLWGALIGAAAGAVLCGVLGHVFLDPPEAELTVSAPPPPLPEPTAVAEPLPPPVKQRIVLRGVNFDFNSSEIRPDSRPVLDQAARILNEHPGVTVRVEGHTDAIGGAEYNEALSVRRAESVYRYLVNQGVDPERFTIEGFGKSRPIASNATEAGRAQNRRVELHPNP